MRSWLKLGWLLMASSAALAVAAVGVFAAGPECPPGFHFDPRSGVGCVQTNCFDVGNARWSYTGQCICNDGYSACSEPVEFDSAKCFPNCPHTRLIACVPAGQTCPAPTPPGGTTRPIVSPTQVTTPVAAPGTTETLPAVSPTALPQEAAATEGTAAAKKDNAAAERESSGDGRRELLQSLRDFLAGFGVEDPSAANAAAAGGAVAALLGAWVLANLRQGAKEEDLAGAIAEWRRGTGADAPEAHRADEGEVQGRDQAPEGGAAKPPLTAEQAKAVALARAAAEALQARLGRAPTSQEVSEEMTKVSGRSREDVAAQMRLWAVESQSGRTDGPKGWGSRTADALDRALDSMAPGTRVVNPWTGETYEIPNLNPLQQLPRLVGKGFVDQLRLGEGFAEAIRILEPKSRTMGEFAWDWGRAMTHLVGDALRAGAIARNVDGAIRGISSWLTPKAELPVIREPGTLRSLRPESTGADAGIGTATHNARDVVGAARVQGQLASDTCSYAVERNIVNELKGLNHGEKWYFWRNELRVQASTGSLDGQAVSKLAYRGQGHGATVASLADRLASHDLRVWDVPTTNLNPDYFRVNLRYPDTAVVAVRANVDGSRHVLRLLEVHGTGSNAVVRVYDPASPTPGVGRELTMTWTKFRSSLARAMLVSAS